MKFLIKTKETSIYFAGDTGFGEHFNEINEIYDNIDYCLMPIGAYNPNKLMENSHISPTEAIDAFNNLKGGTFVPMHYGTYDLSDEPLGEPVRLLLENKNKLKGSLKIADPGEILSL